MAEEVKGVAFDKCYGRRETLLGNECTMLPTTKGLLPHGVDDTILMGMVTTLGVRVVDGDMDLDDSLSVNRLFMDMKTRMFREALTIWKKAEI